MQEVYITIDHIESYCGTNNIRVGDTLTLKKEHDNGYDDEAIAVYCKHDVRCGYVANSVSTVARGTYSAGRLYDKFDETAECTVMFVLEDYVIAKLSNMDGNK